MPEKTERDPLGLFNINSVAKLKIEGPFGNFFRKKSRNAEKTKWGPLVLSGIMLRGKPFWFSSLGQRVQFGVFLKFGRTILVTSGVSKKNTDEEL